MQPAIVLQRRFRMWRYTIGHSELLLHGPAVTEDEEHLNVLFESVDAVKLRQSYNPLILQPADDGTRAAILSFAAVPARFQARTVCLSLPTPGAEPGFIVCARATVLAHPHDRSGGLARGALNWDEHTRVLHRITGSTCDSPVPTSER